MLGIHGIDLLIGLILSSFVSLFSDEGNVAWSSLAFNYIAEIPVGDLPLLLLVKKSKHDVKFIRTEPCACVDEHTL